MLHPASKRVLPLYCIPASPRDTTSSVARDDDDYTHVARQGGAGVRSPLDVLNDVNSDELRAVIDATRSHKTMICEVMASLARWRGKTLPLSWQPKSCINRCFGGK